MFKRPLLFILLLSVCTLQAQVGKGFEKLDDQAFEEALEIFQAARTNESEKIPAQWGIAQILADKSFGKHDYDSAYALKLIVESGLRKHKDSKDKKKWSKKYNLNADALKELAKPLPTQQWEELTGSKSLAEFDNFKRILYKRTTDKIRKAFDKEYNAVRRNAVQGGAQTYEEIDYVLDHHAKYIKDTFPGRLIPLQNALFEVYMTKRAGSVDSIPSFFKQQPNHPYTSHSAKNALENSLKTNTSVAWLQFLNAYPESPFEGYVVKHLEQILTKQPIGEVEKNTLGESEQWLYEDIITGVQTGERINAKSTFEGKNEAQWDRFIRRRADKPDGLAAVKSMLRYYINKRNWDAAAKALKDYASLFPKEDKWFNNMTNLVAGPDNGIRPVPIGNNINTLGDEYSPTISYDGKTIAFCGASRKETIWGEDIYFSELNGTEWSSAKLSRDLSGTNHEAPMCFTADGNTMIFFKNGKVFSSNRNATGWGPANPFPVNLEEFGWVSDVHFVPGEQRVFFAGRLKGIEWDYPKTDIYMVAKTDDGDWGKPVLMGAPINTAVSDRSPFIHPDQTTMYFSSAREGGLGDLDVYKTVRLDETWTNWSEPVNLGKNINSPGNNWGYVVSTDGSTAYYSAKVEGRTDEDIFTILLPQEARPQKKVVPVLVLVTDENKKPVPNAKVEVRSSQTGTNVGEYRTSPKGGKVTVYVPEGDRYTISSIQPGYFSDPVGIDSKDEGKTVEIVLRPIKKMIDEKEKTSLNADILFDLNKSELKPEAAGQLKFVADFAKREQLTMSLSGHTDPTGSDEENMVLSKARAEAVKTALEALGIKAENITAEGFGESRLICTENTPQCHQRNRRVEIIFGKK